MRAARRAVGCFLLSACGLAACTPLRAGQPAQPAFVAITSDDEDVAVDVQAAATTSATPASQSCRVPCTIRTLPGPARVTVRTASHRDEQSVELLAGPQHMRVRPRDPTLQALGWVAVGIAVVGIGVGIYASTFFKSDGQPSSPSEPQHSTPQWAKVALTTSILGVVPLTLGGVYLLDRGSAAADVERAQQGRIARPVIGWATAF
jgi:hypothetical protein